MVGKHAGCCLGASNAVPAQVECRSKLALGVTCAVLLLGALAPRTASACSTRPPLPTLSGYPSDGELEVPTDVVPFYDTASLSATNRRITEVKLTSSEGDVLVARTAAAQLRTIELTLGEALQPNTQYTLEATLNAFEDTDPVETLTLTFTTAAGPVSAPPAPPQGFLRQFQFAVRPKSSCDLGEYGTCVVLSSGFPVEATYIDASGQESPYVFLYREPWITDLTGISSHSASCVKLRARGANAIYSLPVVFCGADAPTFTIRGSEKIACTSQGLTQDGALVTSSAGGPSESPSGGSDQGGSDQGGSEQGGSDQVDARESPSETSTSCSCGLAPGGKQANAALSALFALALAVRLRRTRRRSGSPRH